ncbi:MAG: hypothetical protein QOF43_2374, partial [Gaiellaceae bacterium]|nr:hypothetical protein [Gaiellaceae bacterium]
MAAQRAAIAVFGPRAELEYVAVVAAPPTEASGARRVLGLGNLKPPAAAYLAATVVAATALGAAVLSRLSFDAAHWGIFALLLGLATVAQLFIVEKPGGQSYRTAIVFIIAAAILLPAPFVVLVSAFHYVPSWFRHKKKNVVRVFNVANTTIA